MKQDAHSTDLHTHLLSALRNGDLNPGQRLPTERAFADQFGVSRGAVQRVLQNLEEKGLIFRKIGSGTFVSDHLDSAVETFDHGVDITKGNLAEHVEARAAFEPWVIATAARYATSDHKQELRKRLERVSNPEDWLDYKESVYQFFRLLYEITENGFLLHIFDLIIKAREDVRFGGERPKTRVSLVIRNNMVRSLETIAEPVEQNNPEKAEAASREFLDKMILSVNT
ncbi:Pyruvate dehydrogenase complex repressor [Pseudovibrio sp. W64]|uniref:DNA-binding transcriptional regulator, FadR family n=1 Tax=Pseudovibrio ascidiaceicola TaxID=285279 RepID=A0A1I4FU44_9HYPH|nr:MULTISPECIES: GntR family transcriptional regulator [Pseudovibrio]KZK77968.1 Pyruvate dehydrogenase complex repressor [Pseudovibrio sp. W64]SFL20181.1 DNA-binding transcriptional regulator, FadR family [Pseudovibrio ascidiaceicola]